MHSLASSSLSFPARICDWLHCFKVDGTEQEKSINDASFNAQKCSYKNARAFQNFIFWNLFSKHRMPPSHISGNHNQMEREVWGWRSELSWTIFKHPSPFHAENREWGENFRGYKRFFKWFRLHYRNFLSAHRRLVMLQRCSMLIIFSFTGNIKMSATAEFLIQPRRAKKKKISECYGFFWKEI